MAKNPDKKSGEYWKNRFQELENRQHGMSVKRAKEIMVNFDKATSEIEQKITYWYQRIADNNNISLQEARKLLSDAQLKEFKWSVDDYIKYGKQNAIDGRWMKELENASARARISRLEALKLQVRNEVEKAYASSEEELVSHMESVFKDSMYHTAYEIQKGLDRCETFAKVSPERVRKIMDKPWCPDGKTFSARIWEDRDKLVSSLDTQLTRMCITGAAPDRVIKEMTKLLGAKKSNVARLVMTESAYISSAAQKECFKELDVEQYKVLAVLDSKTSEVCQEMDGQIFKMSEYQEGVTAPPFHPNCRSTTIPYFDDEWFKSGSRSARDKDGNYIEVPEDMTYAEWKEKYVDNTRENVIIKSAKENGINGVVNVEPKPLNLEKYSYDDAHINEQREHNVTREEAEQFMKDASVSLTRWNGRYVNFYGEKGAVYIDTEKKVIRTAFKKEEFDEKINNFMKVVLNYGR